MKFSLVGVNGNAYCIMGYVKNAMQTMKFSQEEIQQYFDCAMSDDYDNLLRVSVAMVKECNKLLKKRGLVLVKREDGSNLSLDDILKHS